MKVCMSVEFNNDERKALTKLLGNISPAQLKDMNFNPDEITTIERVFMDFCGLPEEEVDKYREGFNNSLDT